MVAEFFEPCIMDKRVLEWNWDREASSYLLQGLFQFVEKAAELSDGDTVLDLGGQSGSLCRRTGYRHPICIDIEPKRRFTDVHYVKGDIRKLPFDRDEFDLVLAKAVLHHVPHDLDTVMGEVRRVTRKGGYVVIQEPLSGNILSSLAGKFFTTDIHDEDEKPLEPEMLLGAVKRYFDVVGVKPFYLTTYLLPHVISRLPGPLKPSFRGVTRLMHGFDEHLLKGYPCLFSRSSYIAIMATR